MTVAARMRLPIFSFVAVFSASDAAHGSTVTCRSGRKLLQVRAYLMYLPQDQELRKECEQLEAMYKALLEEAG